MNRILHITINDGAAAAPRRGTSRYPGRNGTDPGSDYVMPPPDDPGSDYVMPPPDDPGSDYVMPPPDDPNGYTFGGPGTTAVYGYSTAAPVHGCCCGEAAGTRPAASPSPFVAPREYSGFVIVRTADGVVGNSSAENLWTLAELHKPKLAGLQAVLELTLASAEKDAKSAVQTAALDVKHPTPIKHCPKGEVVPEHLPEPPAGALVSRPLVELQDCEKDLLPRRECLDILRELEKKAATTAFPPRHSLTAYWRIDLRQHPELVADVVSQLNELAEVDLAYRELVAVDSQVADPIGKVLAEDQGYLEDAPMGISAPWAWQSLNGYGQQPVILCDLEQGWNTKHTEIKPRLQTGFLYGANRADDDKDTPGHHGTAVLGQLAATGTTTFGIKGAATDQGKFFLASHYKAKDDPSFGGTNGHVAAAIAQAIATKAGGPLTEGAILLLEVQRGRLPTEVDEADFDAIRLASGQGVIVIEAAGNGGFNLDLYKDPDTGRTLRRGDSSFRDSGAVFVGAARAALPHDRAPFSNYGSRLDCFGWGEAVTTCGYGDLAGTGEDLYTNSFSGTSSASPVIAGAAALLQALHFKHAQVRLGPLAMRALLSDPATGTRQGPNVGGHIGVMPDLKAVVRDRLQLVPDVYLRHSIDDDGSPRGPKDEISSSPDVLFRRKSSALSVDHFKEKSLLANLPAAGDPIEAGTKGKIYVRLRNRGLGKGTARVQLFASPVATLITPERWVPIGSVDVTGIPEGDTLCVKKAISWTVPAPAPQSASNRPWSLLAIRTGDVPPPQTGAGHCDWAVGLPPGPPYFDWAEYRAFLRRPGVAWRNTHRVPDGSSLSFYIAGVPDRAREFDFEVIQRLPANAKVTLQVQPALAAKLRQRQPWLAGNAADILLPRRPRTLFSRVQLAACAWADATFKVEADSSIPLGPGHSLAIRQLWKGEEVGRITWYFGLDA